MHRSQPCRAARGGGGGGRAVKDKRFRALFDSLLLDHVEGLPVLAVTFWL